MDLDDEAPVVLPDDEAPVFFNATSNATAAGGGGRGDHAYTLYDAIEANCRGAPPRGMRDGFLSFWDIFAINLIIFALMNFVGFLEAREEGRQEERKEDDTTPPGIVFRRRSLARACGSHRLRRRP